MSDPRYSLSNQVVTSGMVSRCSPAVGSKPFSDGMSSTIDELLAVDSSSDMY
jgi:hypothetical protein